MPTINQLMVTPSVTRKFTLTNKTPQRLYDTHPHALPDSYIPSVPPKLKHTPLDNSQTDNEDDSTAPAVPSDGLSDIEQH